MTTCSDLVKMAFSCTRYRLIVVILLSLIMWHLFSMFPGDSAKKSTKLAQVILCKFSNYFHVVLTQLIRCKQNCNKNGNLKLPVVFSCTYGLLFQAGIVELEDDKFNIHKQDKVKVRVYYEALCPDSKHFFMRHLRPVTEKLSEFLEIALIPYGKATVSRCTNQFIMVKSQTALVL